MTFALVIIPPPAQSSLEGPSYTNLVETLKLTMPKEGVEQISENSYSIDLSIAMDFFYSVLDKSKDFRFPCKTLFLDSEPKFSVLSK